MKQVTVDAGKTLLVDGPASVALASGIVEVFGFNMSGTSKIVIREGKRLPFAVREKALFNISLGENAGLEEVDGDTIPSSWAKAHEEIRKVQARPATAVIIGPIDSGKSSFCTYLANKLLIENKKVALLDGDLGQSDIGPPCTVAYAIVKKPVTDLFNLKAENAFFVGATSPSTSVDKTIEGICLLKEEILKGEPDYVIVNTDGWVEGEEAVKYKAKLIEKIKPNIVFYIQQKDELSPILNALEGFSKIAVESPPAIKQRSREKRKSLRELGYIKYLANAKVQSLPLSWLKIEENDFLGLGDKHGDTKQARKIYEVLGMKPLHFAELKDKICLVVNKTRWITKESLKKLEETVGKKVTLVKRGEEENLLVALYNSERKFLGIGVLREIDFARKIIKIFTAVSKDISTVVLGKIKLDKNFKETPVFTEE
ncbi:MAG: Clp1/GlmU family protein [Candidatus Bathyarchaeia archaeon]